MLTLRTDETPVDVRKIANIVQKHLDSLIPLTTSQGQRVKQLVKHAQSDWNTINSTIEAVAIPEDITTTQINRLKSLSVGPFRGFVKNESFDLDSNLILIYGPNGTGKSSFCEALEYSLTGFVAEAESKRFRNQIDYFKNAYTKTFSPPVILGVDKEGNESPVSPNENLYRYCFIEKNRIDNFSRIAAQAPSKQTELISSLFGLDDFTEFVRNFSENIDGRYIDVEGVRAKELNQKTQVLAGYKQQLEKTIPEELQSISDEEEALANKYRENCTFLQMIAELNGTDQQTGLIAELEQNLQKPVEPKANQTLVALHSLQNTIDTAILVLTSEQQQLSEYSQQVSFKQLYEAVLQVKGDSLDQCPACNTPITQVKVNPYTNADTELKKLQHLGQLQDEVKKVNEDLSASLYKMAQIVSICCKHFPEDNLLSEIQISEGNVATIDWWKLLYHPLENDLTPWQFIEHQIDELEKQDIEIDKAAAQKLEKHAELKRLREFSDGLIKLQTRKETTDKAKKKAIEAIDSFSSKNAQVIAEVDAEKGVVAINQTITSAYATFVQKINIYKDGLPALLVADLGSLVVELYNAYNRHDSDSEKLAEINLPLHPNDRLEISFKSNPESYYDALHILSEGHIRCIGLAILTAKNLKEKCPFLIFDDPVNAIDDEHRQSIRETFFIDDYFKTKQLLIAVHGEEFFNRTHQIIGKEASLKAQSYLFSPKNDQHINVNSLRSPKNYVSAARDLYNTGEYRDSLMSARRAVENLCEKAWYHYGKHCDKSDNPISVSRRSPNQPWDLRALADNLKSKFIKSKGAIPNKDEIVGALSNLLGTDATQPPWTYYNKGTHDETDLPEFEASQVDSIVSELEKLDAALL
ncbi:MAG TPA: AAA family ATPase [Marinilabiliaceae bacterium]|nr:AAA family ATPase [Marinilabiliaceae bacterium]